MHLKEYYTLLLGLFLILTTLTGNRIAASDRNLLINPGAEEFEAFSGWTRVEAPWSKIGWSQDFYKPHSGKHHWTGCRYVSGVPTLLIQTIDLIAMGYDSLLLDSSPVISAGAYVTNIDYYQPSDELVLIQIELIDKNDSVFKTEYAANDLLYIPSWKLKYSTLSGYGTGLRKIRFTMGCDGFSTIHLDDAFVYIIDETKALTDDATNITHRSALLNGIVYPDHENTEAFFEYDTTTALEKRVAANPAAFSGDSSISVNAPVVLNPSKTYYFRLVSISQNDTSYGQTLAFRTNDVILSASDTVQSIRDTVGSKISIQINSTVKWNAIIDVPWLSVSPDSADKNSVLTISVTEANLSALPRKAMLKIMGDTVEVIIKITQIRNSIYVIPKSLVVSADADTFAVKIRSEYNWTATTNIPWLTVLSDSLHVNSFLDFCLEENTTGIERTGIISITNLSDTATLTIRQKILNGKGTRTEPFLISDYNQLKSVHDSLKAHYRLVNNIDASASFTENQGKGFYPIAAQIGQYFQGSFDGNGFVISDLYIYCLYFDTRAGLFGNIRNTEVKNLGLVNCRITGFRNTGGIAGKAINSVIHNCYVSGNIISGINPGGGIVGHLESSIISDCYTAGTIEDVECGGISGLSDSSHIMNCYTLAEVSDFKCSGLVYHNRNSTIRNCYVGGTIKALDCSAIVNNSDSSLLTGNYYNSDLTHPNIHNYGIALSTQEMKRDSSFNAWDFDNKWIIRKDSTYPGLRSLNNAPFAFNDTVEVTGYTHMSQVLKNDFDIETLQSRLAYKVEKIYSNGEYSKSWFNFPNPTVDGTLDSLCYSVGEILESGDTLWGGKALAFMKKVPNDIPEAVDDTIYALRNNPMQIPSAFFIVNDSDKNGNRIIINYLVKSPVHGTFAPSKKDSMLYIPDHDWHGTDSVSYCITDGYDLDTAWIKIFVRREPEINWENPEDIFYGYSLGEEQLNASADTEGDFIYNPSIGAILNAGDSQILSVLFHPEDKYLYTEATGSVRISVYKAELRITADSQSVYQGDPLPEFTLQYEGFVCGDSVKDLDELPVVSTQAVPTDPPGSYDIVLSGGSDNNYTYILINGMLDIGVKTGLNNFVTDFCIYPNPFTDYIKIKQSTSDVIGYEISSLTGLILKKGVIVDGLINLQDLNSGMYILGIELEGNVRYLKIVKE